MIVRWLRRQLLRKHDKTRLFLVQYQMEYTAYLMADFVMLGDEENAKIMAMRYTRLDKEASALKVAIRRR